MSNHRTQLMQAAVALFAAFTLSATAAVTNRTPPVLVADDAHIRVARELASALPRMHLSREPVDDHIAQSALDMYLDGLDFDHSFFLASDVIGFRQKARELDDQLKRGELDTAFQIYNVFKERVKDRVAFVDTLLAEGFDVKAEETYDWKRRKAPWATDRAQWDELWRKRVKNEYVGRLVARQMEKENPAAAATNVAKSADAAGGPAAAPVTDVPAETLAELQLTPEQSIAKSYKRFLTILDDNDAAFVLDRYFNAFTQSYDPHSDYLSPDNTEDFDIGMRLSLFGIGALLTSDEGAAKIERLIPGGPAAKDGRLKVGDKIVAVAQGEQPSEDILHLPLQKSVRKIRGEKGTKVVLTVQPVTDPSGSTFKKVDLIRDEVKLEEQAAKGEVQEITDEKGVVRKLGVVRLPEFYADMKSNRADARSASRDVVAILGDLQKQGVEGIILDLRGNGGGSLAESVTLTGAFIESGPVVQVKDQRRLQILSDPDPSTVYNGPLIVLVNRLSASASEILAAALQDYGRALIVGDSKTHGKGTVQTLATLSESLRSLRAATNDLGSIKLTTASFYRIAGGSTQLNGVKPDIIIPSPMDQMEVGEEFLPHALAWTEVYQAFYDPVRDFGPLLPALRDASAKRREKDPAFAAFGQLVSRVAERQKTSSISLNYEGRLALARSEKDLEKQLKEQEADPAEPVSEGTAKKGPDPILKETLNILSDLISSTSHTGPLTASADPT
jgi:carboxyl-terminal processing protease